MSYQSTSGFVEEITYFPNDVQPVERLERKLNLKIAVDYIKLCKALESAHACWEDFQREAFAEIQGIQRHQAADALWKGHQRVAAAHVEQLKRTHTAEKALRQRGEAIAAIHVEVLREERPLSASGSALREWQLPRSSVRSLWSWPRDLGRAFSFWHTVRWRVSSPVRLPRVSGRATSFRHQPRLRVFSPVRRPTDAGTDPNPSQLERLRRFNPDRSQSDSGRVSREKLSLRSRLSSEVRLRRASGSTATKVLILWASSGLIWAMRSPARLIALGNLWQSWISWGPESITFGQRQTAALSTATWRLLQTSRRFPWSEGFVASAILIRISNGRCSIAQAGGLGVGTNYTCFKKGLKNIAKMKAQLSLHTRTKDRTNGGN